MNYLYEYAIIRVVPRVEREEFINVGVILFSKKSGFLQTRLDFQANKILCLDPKADIDMIDKNLAAFQKIALGENCESAISQLPPAERFRWLTATRSTIIQCSKVHPGYAENLEDALDNLMTRFFSESE